MRTLSKQQIILLHEHMIQETGGAHGLRDEGMLDSALAAPSPFKVFCKEVDGL